MTLSSSGYLHAVLGPTNTGKTHYALSRMVAHESGIIGFPLRLLARENYDRLVALKGKDHVGLVTGEEKIIPQKAKWFSCTVESMPLDRRVKFIAIDEIQLAGDPDRGHIFTNRLLHARGQEETLFLGADVIRPLLRKLIPEITIETRPRLSNLTYTGPLPLNRLPPRSAIVAFSATDVYALAETMRQKRGGCALIMGRLSPRTRNAQIELYQKGEVDYLVATDAIGMGLNMDVDHIALSSLRKFDGRQHRTLSLQEIAQIAGRAGRGMKDGTFGTLAGSDTLSAETIAAIEAHDFAPLKQIYWRQPTLDFSTPQMLLKSLQAKPPSPELIKGREASDLSVLEHLVASETITNAARGPKATRLLWEVCQVPDFKKLGDGSHAQLCEKLYLHLLRDGKIPTSWIEGQLRALDQKEGGIDTLMQRLQSVRVCSYIASHPHWLSHSLFWQTHCHDVENRLSDALHERLTARFVNKRAVTLLKRHFADHKGALFYQITKEKRLLVEGHDIGQIRGFNILLDDTTSKSEETLLLKTARRALQAEMPALVRQFLSENRSAFSITPQAAIEWSRTPIGRLERGEHYFTPKILLFAGEFQDMTQRKAVLDHLHMILSEQIDILFAPLQTARKEAAHDPLLRGIIHRLIEDGGLTRKQKSDTPLTATQHRLCRRYHIVIGERFIYSATLFKRSPAPMLLLLHRLWSGRPESLPGRVTIGSFTLPVVRLEKALYAIRRSQSRSRQTLAPSHLASLLGIKQRLLPEILKHLGIACLALQSLPEGIYGPDTPLMLKATRQVHKRKKKEKPDKTTYPDKMTESPFSILRQLSLLR